MVDQDAAAGFDPLECRRLAGELDLASFCRRFPYLFLLNPDIRRIRAREASGNAEAEERIMYETAMVDVRALARSLKTAIIVPVKKKPGNPFAERISVGRAPNCDLVFRYSHVSKLHAHFLVDGAKLSLVDQKSSNGTFVNGRQLEAGVPQPVKAGDSIRFGSLVLDLGSADELYARSRVQSLS